MGGREGAGGVGGGDMRDMHRPRHPAHQQIESEIEVTVLVVWVNKGGALGCGRGRKRCEGVGWVHGLWLESL